LQPFGSLYGIIGEKQKAELATAKEKIVSVD
jgi:hypothetical protein